MEKAVKFKYLGVMISVDWVIEEKKLKTNSSAFLWNGVIMFSGEKKTWGVWDGGSKK